MGKNKGSAGEGGRRRGRKRKLPAEPNGQRVLLGTRAGCKADFLKLMVTHITFYLGF
jgi:hypothetical protein